MWGRSLACKVAADEAGGNRLRGPESLSTLRVGSGEARRPAGGAAMQIKMTVSLWAPLQEEMLRVPALRELAAIEAWQQYLVRGVFGQVQGGAFSMGDIYKGVPVVLRQSMEMTMATTMAGITTNTRPCAWTWKPWRSQQPRWTIRYSRFPPTTKRRLWKR